MYVFGERHAEYAAPSKLQVKVTPAAELVNVKVAVFEGVPVS